MPYKVSKPPARLVKKLKKKHPGISKKNIRKFIHIFNSSLEKGDDEKTAFSKAWGSIKKKKAFEIIQELIKISDAIDEIGFTKDADELDDIISNLIF